MTLTQFRYLVAVVDHGTVSAAARATHVAQPAMSRAIQALETRLGVTLFDRHGGRLSLTPSGSDIVDQARRVLAESVALDSLATRLRTRPPHTLTLVSTPTLEVIGTIPLLRQLGDTLVGTRVTTHTVTEPEGVVEQVTSGDADLGLVDVAPPDHLDHALLHAEEIVLAAPAGSPVTPVGVRELGAIPLVAPRCGSHRRAEFDSFFATADIEPTIAVEAGATTSWDGYVLGGIASAFQYRSKAELLAPHGVVVRALDPPILRRVLVVFRPTGVSPAARAAVEAIRAAHCRRPPAGRGPDDEFRRRPQSIPA